MSAVALDHGLMAFKFKWKKLDQISFKNTLIDFKMSCSYKLNYKHLYLAYEEYVSTSEK